MSLAKIKPRNRNSTPEWVTWVVKNIDFFMGIFFMVNKKIIKIVQ